MDMIILGIETSCDETGVALIDIDKEGNINILSNLLSSQVEIHRQYGGVYPLLAKRAHQENLPVLFEEARIKAGNPDINAVSVTVGPGLEPCLWTGVNFAEDVSKKLDVPLIPVNHLEAHILASFIDSDIELREVFPFLSLLVSGGHTQLVLAEDLGDYKMLGGTRDDAAGECFDKIGRMLGLGYPGGPEIEKKASQFDPQESDIEITLPRPMIHSQDYDFSFSGLKTAALYHYKKQDSSLRESEEYVRAMSAEVQQAVLDVLIYKTLKAAREYQVEHITLGGGVIANKELRRQLREEFKEKMPRAKLLVPAVEYATDNALMIAFAGYINWVIKEVPVPKKIEVDANLGIEGAP